MRNFTAIVLAVILASVSVAQEINLVVSKETAQEIKEKVFSRRLASRNFALDYRNRGTIMETVINRSLASAATLDGVNLQDKDSIDQRILETSSEAQSLVCVNDSLLNTNAFAAGTCRIIGTVNSGSGLGVSVNFSISGGTVRTIEVTRAGVTFVYNRQVSAHSELSGACFAAHYTVKATFTDGSTCTVTTTGSAPHSACTDTAANNSSTVVSAASFADFMAPGAIAAAFGLNYTSQTDNARAIPLPTTLGGVRAYVYYNTPLQQEVGIFYASPGQVNFLLPKDMAYGGLATAQVINIQEDALRPGFFVCSEVEPSIFTTSQNGNGPAAGYYVGNQVILYGTGFNGRTYGQVRTGNQVFESSFVGSTPGFVGLDQMNTPISAPRGAQAQVCVGTNANNIRCSRFFQLP